jgi:hypothetical protein
MKITHFTSKVNLLTVFAVSLSFLFAGALYAHPHKKKGGDDGGKDKKSTTSQRTNERINDDNFIAEMQQTGHHVLIANPNNMLFEDYNGKSWVFNRIECENAKKGETVFFDLELVKEQLRNLDKVDTVEEGDLIMHTLKAGYTGRGSNGKVYCTSPGESCTAVVHESAH